MKHCGDDLAEGKGTKRKAVTRVDSLSLLPHLRPADVSSTVKVRRRRS